MLGWGLTVDVATPSTKTICELVLLPISLRNSFVYAAISWALKTGGRWFMCTLSPFPSPLLSLIAPLKFRSLIYLYTATFYKAGSFCCTIFLKWLASYRDTTIGKLLFNPNNCLSNFAYVSLALSSLPPSVWYLI